MSHKCRIRDETGLVKKSDRFQKFSAPVNLHAGYCYIFCWEVGSVVYCLKFSEQGPLGPGHSYTCPKTDGGNEAKYMKAADVEVTTFLIGFYTDLERLVYP